MKLLYRFLPQKSTYNKLIGNKVYQKTKKRGTEVPLSVSSF
jgi:hypothetical protein